MFASLILRQADLATHVDWIEIHFDIYISVWSGLVDQQNVDQLTAQNVRFDILDPPKM